MGRLFNLDSPVVSFLNKMADLIFLNFLTAVCCIPIFTIGAAMTALNYVVLKMVRNEEGYLTKAFFKSFKENFKQATIIWLLMLLVVFIFGGDIFIMRYSNLEFPRWLVVSLVAVGVLAIFAVMHVFPMLARFENSVKGTFKNSFLMGILSFPKTIVMMLCWLIPVAIIIFLPQVLPLVVCFGISGPVFLNALLYSGTFKRFEPKAEEDAEEDEWTIEEEESKEESGQ